MRVAVLADIHANWEALNAVWEDLRREAPEAVYCLGDVVGYGADPQACWEWVQAHCPVRLRGNHEEAVLRPEREAEMNPAAAAAIRWTRDQLTAPALADIDAWPLVESGADARLVHGSPLEPLAFHYISSRWDAENAFQHFSEHACFFGHTHISGVVEEIVPGALRVHPVMGAPSQDPVQGTLALEADKRYLVNVGSVGQPRDRDPRAKWLLVSGAPLVLEFRAVPYDVAVAQKKILAAGLPKILAERLSFGQ
jgi:diadenosine tetraphosphatase ApaH/serine/threonine PP2A family protein phosphatase